MKKSKNEKISDEKQRDRVDSLQAEVDRLRALCVLRGDKLARLRRLCDKLALAPANHMIAARRVGEQLEKLLK